MDVHGLSIKINFFQLRSNIEQVAPTDCEVQRAEIFDTTYHFEIPPFWLRLSTFMLSSSWLKHWENIVLKHRKLSDSFGCLFFLA